MIQKECFGKFSTYNMNCMSCKEQEECHDAWVKDLTGKMEGEGERA